MESRCMFRELEPLVGYAATATIRARGPLHGDQTALYRHVRDVPGPRVVAGPDLDEPPGSGSPWGEGNATLFGALGWPRRLPDRRVRHPKEGPRTGFPFFGPR